MIRVLHDDVDVEHLVTQARSTSKGVQLLQRHLLITDHDAQRVVRREINIHQLDDHPTWCWVERL